MIEEVFDHLSSKNNRPVVISTALNILTDTACILQYKELYKSHMIKIEACLEDHLQDTVLLLINICAEISDISESMNKTLILNTVIKNINISSHTPYLINALCMLLANLTVLETTMDTLYHIYNNENSSPSSNENHKIESMDSNTNSSSQSSKTTLDSHMHTVTYSIESIIRIISSFLHHNPHNELPPTDNSWDLIDNYQYISNFICNITSTEEGRKIILNRKYDFLPNLILQLRSKNDIRRKGVILAIKNILFDSNIHWWLVYETNLVVNICYLLVVPTPFTEKEKEGMDMLLKLASTDENKKFESDLSCRKALVESVLLLCQTRIIREELRKRKVYPILRNLDYVQEGEEVSDVILEIVQFLMRDEEPSKIGSEERTENQFGITSTENHGRSLVSSISCKLKNASLDEVD